MTRHLPAPVDLSSEPQGSQIERLAPHLGFESAPDVLLPCPSAPPLPKSPRPQDWSAPIAWFYRAGLALVCGFVIAGMGLSMLGAGHFDGVSRQSYIPWAFLNFSEKGNIGDYLGAGWGPADKDGRWTRGDVAQVTIPLATTNSKYLVMQIVFEARVDPRAPQLDLQILANGSTVMTRSYSASGHYDETVRVPLDPAAHADKLSLTFIQDSPVSAIFEDGGDWLHIAGLRISLSN